MYTAVVQNAEIYTAVAYNEVIFTFSYTAVVSDT